MEAPAGASEADARHEAESEFGVEGGRGGERKPAWRAASGVRRKPHSRGESSAAASERRRRLSWGAPSPATFASSAGGGNELAQRCWRSIRQRESSIHRHRHPSFSGEAARGRRRAPPPFRPSRAAVESCPRLQSLPPPSRCTGHGAGEEEGGGAAAHPEDKEMSMTCGVHCLGNI